MVIYSKIFVALASLAVVAGLPRPQGDGLDGLRRNIPGEPGRDYPIYSVDVLRKVNNPRQLGAIAGSNGDKINHIPRDGRNNRRNGNQNLEQVALGQIPGRPGQDYPTNSVQGLKNKFPNLKLAPAHLITPNYPKNSAQNNRGNNNQNRRNNRPIGNKANSRPHTNPHSVPRPSPVQVPQSEQSDFVLEPRPTQATFNPRPSNQVQSTSNVAPPLPFVPTDPDPAYQEEVFNGNYCPGGALEECINFCPTESYGECTARCAEEC